MKIRESTYNWFQFVHNAHTLDDITTIIRGGAVAQNINWSPSNKTVVKSSYVMVVYRYCFSFDMVGDEITQDTFTERFASHELVDDKLLTLE